ncbi:protein-disulfide reductase [Enterobacterales bacterium CwR94]|nr:protein-disulfide reductase [Enterobacterales bacterium CwR94]
MITLLRNALLGLLALWLPVAFAADTGWLKSPLNDHAEVRLRADPQAPEGTRILLNVKLQPGWKTYWRTPGEGGIAPEITWQDATVKAQWFWPTPQRFDVSGISTQGYHDGLVLPIQLTGHPTSPLRGTLTLSTCSNVCILTDYPFTLDLTQPASADFAHDYAQAMGKVPVADALQAQLTAGYRPGEVQLVAERAGGWQSPELYVDMPEGASLGKPVIQTQGERLEITVPASDEWGETAPDLTGKTLSLVLVDNGIAQQSTVTLGGPLSLASQALPLWQIILMALAGGFILNLMPCVLPVLGMKLSSILHVEQRDRRSVRMQFLASTAGILVSFMALALLMTVLRASNQALGWGIQFQNPWFIALLVIVSALFSANLFGLLYFRLPSAFSTRLATHQGKGLSGNFAEGAFATLLATPCSAPFLGTAVAFALAAPLPQLWGLFIALGLGMSLPWLLIAAWPTLALRLPRPGQWMNRLRVVLGLMMLASCLWLLSLLTPFLGTLWTSLLAATLIVILLIAIARHYSLRTAAMSAGGAALAVGALFLASSLLTHYGKQPLQDNIAWQPLTEEAIQQALKENKRVFVDVTADWCVTCKANKFNVLLRSDVQKALMADDVVALRGDWTRPSDTLSQFLLRRGSVAVPFNQIYGPGLPQGKTLSPLLDKATLLETLNNAKGK